MIIIVKSMLNPGRSLEVVLPYNSVATHYWTRFVVLCSELFDSNYCVILT